jgi:hypothetical protein
MRFRILVILCFLLGCFPAASQALTVKEILLLKQKGVSEQTIQMMLQSELRAQRSAAGQKMGVKTITRPDGTKAIVYSTGNGEEDGYSRAERFKEKRAWEMLRNIIVDTHTTGN